MERDIALGMAAYESSENEKLRKDIIGKGVDARRRKGKQIIPEENEEYRKGDRALGYTSID